MWGSLRLAPVNGDGTPLPLQNFHVTDWAFMHDSAYMQYMQAWLKLVSTSL